MSGSRAAINTFAPALLHAHERAGVRLLTKARRNARFMLPGIACTEKQKTGGVSMKPPVFIRERTRQDEAIKPTFRPSCRTGLKRPDVCFRD